MANLTRDIALKHRNIIFVCCYFRLCLSNALCNVGEGCGILCNFVCILYLYHMMFTIKNSSNYHGSVCIVDITNLLPKKVQSIYSNSDLCIMLS